MKSINLFGVTALVGAWSHFCLNSAEEILCRLSFRNSDIKRTGCPTFIASLLAGALLLALSGSGFAQCLPLTITSQPRSVTNAPCSTNCATFAVTATGSAPVSYQWFFNGAAIPGANGPSFTVCPVTSANAGTYTVRLANQCSARTSTVARLVVILDTVRPTITCPGDQSRWICSNGPVRVFYPAPAASDNLDPNPTVTCVPASGSFFALGDTTVRCTARDDCGNTNSCSFLVKVIRDLTPPVIACPSNRVVWTCQTNPVPFNYTVTATDDCDTNVTITCTPPSGIPVAPGSIVTVNCVARDDCGNSDGCSFSLRVVRDTSPPVINCPSNIVRMACTNRVPVSYTVTATDDCDPNPKVTCAPPSGSLFPAGTTTVNCTAVDDCGNTSTCSFRVTVTSDTVPPVVHCPTNVTVWTCQTNGARVTYPRVTAGDTADGSVPVTCVPTNGSHFPLGTTTVTCTAQDKCGNRASCSFTVTVRRDTTPPRLTCPDHHTVWAVSSNGATVYYTVNAVDDSLGRVTISCSPPSGSFLPLGSNVVTCTARDACGNAATCSFVVNVIHAEMHVLMSRGNAVLSWVTEGTLETAASATGPWMPVANARSPYTISPLARSAFFRLKVFVPPGPGITGFSPRTGLPGTIVRVNGHGFSPDPFANHVTIGGSIARVISGDTTHLRVVALRNVATGPIAVTVGADTASSAEEFRREGSTLFATPMADSDSELIEGIAYPMDRHYDMMAQGVNQKILVVLTTPSDINPEDLAPLGKTARQDIVDKLAQANTFFQQASYNKTSADFVVTPGWIPLSQIRDFYCWQQDDIDRAQASVDAAQADLDALLLDPTATAEDIEDAEEELDEANEKLNTAQNGQGLLQEPQFFFAESLLGAKAAVVDFDTFPDYFVVVAGPFMRGQNFGTETAYHAESANPELDLGPFDIVFPAPKGITYVAQEADWGRMVHELSHFFSGGDLYSHSYADGSYLEGNAAAFDMMGNHDSHPLYSAYNMDLRLHYFDESADGNVVHLEWGSVPDFDDTFDLVAHAKTEDPVGNSTKHLLRITVTEGLHYYVEVRQRPDPALGAAANYVFDTNLPLDPSNPAWRGGVMLYEAFENNDQANNKERPLSLLPPHQMFQEGDSFYDPERTLRITVTDRLADRPAKYRIRVEWGHLPAENPDGQFDLRITPWGAPPWETVDIWANSIKNDETDPPKIIYKNHEDGDETKPIGNGDPPWVGHDNTLYARVENNGVIETPENVLVSFYLNIPPGVGDNGTFELFDTVDLGTLAAGEKKVVASSRKWRPSVGEHTCIKVFIHPMNGEITFDNNQAQENFGEFETGAASPYQPWEFDFAARNPYDAPGVMDIRARNVPLHWNVALDHGSVWLTPLGEKPIHAVIWTDRRAEWDFGAFTHQPPTNGPRKAEINLEGWMDRFGHKVFAVGGITTLGNAVRKVHVRLYVEQTQRGVGFRVQAWVIPQVGVVPLAIHITDPDGVLHTERAQTDALSHYTGTTQYKPNKPGVYKVQVFTLGGSLAGEAESAERLVVVP